MLSLLVLNLSFSAINNFAVSGYSKKYEFTDSYEIWGGVDSDCSSTSTCNTCGSGALVAPAKSCNPAAIAPTTNLTFTFSSDKNVTNYYIITKDTDAPTGSPIKKTPTTISAGQSGSITLTWGEMCTGFDTPNNSNTCASAASQIFRVGLDANNDGKLDSNDDYKRVTIGAYPQETVGAQKSASCSQDTAIHGLCDYEMFRGDKKAYLLSYVPTSGFPIITDRLYAAIRIYYAEKKNGSCSASSYTYAQYTDFDLITSGSSFTAAINGDGAVTGLTNNVTYCFRSAIVDKAGNVRGITKADGDLDVSNYEATPNEVVGLLEDGNCFIATAAYGNPLDAKIDTFRQFRDEILLAFPLGKQFVDFYYSHSKPLALEILQSPWSQKLTQMILWPLWVITEILLHYPFVLIIAGAVLIVSAKRRKNAV